jgi:putative phosphoesterase
MTSDAPQPARFPEVRVALISDLHGNELALVAVRRRIVELGADLVVCLGDVATLGARPREILDHLRDLGAPCILGNHDEFLLDPALVRTYSEAPIIADAADWCRAELRADDLAFVATFARDVELDLDGTRLLLFHGSPRSNMEDLLATTAPDELDRALDGRGAPVMAGGHTHLAMVRQHRGALLVNPGSVGMPILEHVAGREPRILDHAELAIIDASAGQVSVGLHRVALDRRALRAQAESAAHPLRAALAAQYG